MAGFSIADFFAKLSIKADTREVKKIEDSLNRINKSLKMIGVTSVAQAGKMDKAFKGEALRTQRNNVQGLHDSLERMGSSLVGFKERLNSIDKQSEFVKIKNDIKEATLEAKRFKNELKLHHNTNSILGKENIFKKPDAFNSSNDKGNDATRMFQGGEEFFDKSVQGRRLLSGLTKEQAKSVRELGAEQVKMKRSVIDANLVLKEQASNFRKANRAAANTKKQITALTRAQNRLKESARQLALSMVGAFAVFEGVKSISRVGQDFEAMEASMLAVSGGSISAAKDLSYLRSEAVRLGLNIKDTTKAFIKLKAGAGEKATDSDLKTIFEGLTESSTVLGLSAEETTRAIRGVVQMFGKGGVRAEELRQQVGEVLPVAMRALEKSMGKTSMEITKMLELGQIGTDVLPAFGKELKNIAREGGGLAAALETVRVQENRLFSKLQTSQETIFKGGFGKGQGRAYKSMTALLEKLEPALKVTGTLFRWLFNIISSAVQVLASPLVTLGQLLNVVKDLGIASDSFADQTVPKLVVGAALVRTAWGRVLVGFVAIKAVLEEIYALSNKNVVGQIERDLNMDFGAFGGETPTETQTKKEDQNLLDRTITSFNKSLDYWTSMQPTYDALGLSGLGTPLKPTSTNVTINTQPLIDQSGNFHLKELVNQSLVDGQAQR